jgi:hypothetical protein
MLVQWALRYEGERCGDSLVLADRAAAPQRLTRLVLVVAAQPEVRLTFLVPPHRRPVE